MCSSIGCGIIRMPNAATSPAFAHRRQEVSGIVARWSAWSAPPKNNLQQPPHTVSGGIIATIQMFSGSQTLGVLAEGFEPPDDCADDVLHVFSSFVLARRQAERQ